MATTKKKAAAPKKPAPAKTTKKPAPKAPAKPAPKKPALPVKKATVAKKPAVPAKKPIAVTAKAKPVAAKPAAPKAVAAAAPAKATAKKGATITNPEIDYRTLKKYTWVKLGEIAAELGADASAKDLIKHLKKIEGNPSKWREIIQARSDKRAAGQTLTRGRPKKATAAQPIKPMTSRAAATAALKAGAAFSPRPATPKLVVPAPKGVNGAPRVFRLPPRPAAAPN